MFLSFKTITILKYYIVHLLLVRTTRLNILHQEFLLLYEKTNYPFLHRANALHLLEL